MLRVIRPLSQAFLLPCFSAAICATLAAAPATGESFQSGCTDSYFSRFASQGSDGTLVFDETAAIARSVDDGQNFYTSADGDATRGRQSFAAEYAISDPGFGQSRMLVRDAATDEELGWVEKDAILCKEDPIRDPETGLWQRVFIQTATRSVGGFGDTQSDEVTIEPKQLFRGPALECDDTCETVGRFEWYYVFGTNNGRYLISKSVDLSSRTATGLDGWLKTEDGIPWNTANALRPAIDLDEKDPNYLCAYTSLEDLRASANCREFLGGMLWFEIDLRLPVLDETEEAWRVIFKAGGNNLDRDDLLDALNNEGRRSQVASGLKNLDVLFLIDGTQSVATAIEAIKGAKGRPGIVDQLRSRLAGKLEEGGSFRVGFRVFRDSIKGGGNGVLESENMPLSGLSCDDNNSDFASNFQQVRALDIAEDDDFAENMMGGLQQAVRDIGGCREHTKLIIVIGDHGYSSEKQKSRGHKSVSQEQIRRAIVSSQSFETPPLVFFLQLPQIDLARIKNKQGYLNAYGDFETTALQLIAMQARHYGSKMTAVEQRDLLREMQNDMFIELPSTRVTSAVTDRIVDTINSYLQPAVVEQVGRGGQSIDESIRKLQKRSKGVPLLWWGMAEQRFCGALPEQCTENILDKVDVFYVKKSDEASLVPEVLMTGEQLSDWLSVLQGFKRGWRGEQIRKGLRNTLEQTIGTQLGIQVGNPRHPTEGRLLTLGEILQLKGGLPSGMQSKFLAYTPSNFAPNGLPSCEIRELSDMAGRRFSVFQELQRGKRLPLYEVTPPNLSFCPTLSPTGRELEIIDMETIRHLTLDDPENGIDRTYKHTGGGTQLYWIPLRYIP